ncbi:MAG: pectinesterase family protein, partial [Candidatus Omnitrophica bacterium]|nr:pectinesterase family protein [Candidatus Omnitrophota bacterium]
MKTKWVLGGGITLLLFFALFPTAYATTINIPGQYQTINEAIGRANPGDIVMVQPGTYTENIAIDKAIHLQSVGDDAANTIIQAATSTQPVIAISGMDSSVSGFT